MLFYTPPHKKWRGIMLYPPNFECPSVCPSALRFRALTLVPFDLLSSSFAKTLVSGRSGMGLQVGLFRTETTELWPLMYVKNALHFISVL